MVTIKDLMDVRLRKCLERLEAEARKIRDTVDPTNPVGQSWLKDADAIEYCCSEIRAAVGMEEEDDDSRS